MSVASCCSACRAECRKFSSFYLKEGRNQQNARIFIFIKILFSLQVPLICLHLFRMPEIKKYKKKINKTSSRYWKKRNLKFYICLIIGDSRYYLSISLVSSFCSNPLVRTTPSHRYPGHIRNL